MDKFESQFADLDVQTSYMESTMSDTTALITPQDQVDQLINQVADEAGLEIQHGLGEVKVPAQPVEAGREEVKEEDGRLAERLRALRVSRRAWPWRQRYSETGEGADRRSLRLEECIEICCTFVP
jgi:division protein CdvB (Snf7/Vps24/ESCRT-III family)